MLSLLAALLVVAVSSAYRFGGLGGTLGGFDNDHFAHLARADLILDGELPLRDFADAELRGMWPPLTYMTSAAAQWVFGRSLRSEAVLTVGLLAFGAAATFVVAADVAQGIAAALLMALATIALGPKLYNYPKIVVYALAAGLIVSYARQPTYRRLAWLAILTAVATLYRHDHGVILSATAFVLVMLARPASRVRALLVFALVVSVCLLPGAIFVQRNMGMIEYLRSCFELSRQESARTTATAVMPSVDLSQPLVARDESGNSASEHEGEGVALMSWRVAPGVLREVNAAPWLYLVAWTLVLASLACGLVPRLARVLIPSTVPPAAVAAIAAMGLVMIAVYLRNPIPARFPDVSAPVAILGAFWITAVPRAMRSSTWPLRAAASALLALLVSVTLGSVLVAGEVAHALDSFGLGDGSAGVVKHWRGIWRELGLVPGARDTDDSEFGRAAAYLRRCTRPGDRILVGDNAPELNYFSTRGFAAGQLAFFSNFYTSTADQRAALRRWGRQSVPIALIQPQDRFDTEFGSDYPLLAEYLRLTYERRGRLDFGNQELDVWTRKDRRAALDAATGLPCFSGE